MAENWIVAAFAGISLLLTLGVLYVSHQQSMQLHKIDCIIITFSNTSMASTSTTADFIGNIPDNFSSESIAVGGSNTSYTRCLIRKE